MHNPGSTRWLNLLWIIYWNGNVILGNLPPPSAAKIIILTSYVVAIDKYFVEMKFLSKCVVGKGYVISCTYYISLAFAIGYYNVAPSHRYYGSIICYVERPIKDVPVVTGYILSCSNTNFHYNQEWKFDKLTTFIFHCQSLILLSVSSRLGRTYMDHQLIRPWEIWMRIWKWNFQSCFNDWYLQIFSW